MPESDYEIRSSARRRRTMTAFREEGRLVVVVPAHLSARQRRDLVPPLVQRFLAQESRRSAPRGDADLTARAESLYMRYLQPIVSGPAPTLGVRWVSNQDARWGSCTTSTGEIRLSDRLRPTPAWVVDYVLVHELTHLVEHGHTARFHALVARYPHADRAKAFLEGYDLARRQGAPTG